MCKLKKIVSSLSSKSFFGNVMDLKSQAIFMIKVISLIGKIVSTNALCYRNFQNVNLSLDFEI